MKRKLVSCIIPTYNASETLRNCLNSISKQTYLSIETIVVDDASADQTADVVKEFKKKMQILFLRNKRRLERSRSRNFGAKNASGEYFLFLDADMELSENVIKACVDESKKNDVKAIIIPELVKGQGFWSYCRALEKRCYIGDTAMEAARFIDKKAFFAVGRWNEKMIAGEDWDLQNRLSKNHKIGRIEEYIYHDEGKLSLFGSMHKKFYYAKKSRYYIKQNKVSFHEICHFIFRSSYIRNWRLLAADPLHAFGMLVLKTCEFIAGAYGYVLAK